MRTKDPGTPQYEVFFNADGREAIVFERYRDAEAALAHFDNTGHLMQPLMATATVTGDPDHGPVTYDHCDHVTGPFFHGTRHVFAAGALLTAGHASNYHRDRISNHVYFAALIEAATWGAELAVAYADDDAEGHIYVVEPTGPFEDDPNVTDKKFPGNITRSYRSRHPLRVVEEVRHWEPHPPDVLQQMLDNIARLRELGLDVIED